MDWKNCPEGHCVFFPPKRVHTELLPIFISVFWCIQTAGELDSNQWPSWMWFLGLTDHTVLSKCQNTIWPGSNWATLVIDLTGCLKQQNQSKGVVCDAIWLRRRAFLVAIVALELGSNEAIFSNTEKSITFLIYPRTAVFQLCLSAPLRSSSTPPKSALCCGTLGLGFESKPSFITCMYVCVSSTIPLFP